MDSEEDTCSEEDFSASEEEWIPNKKDKISSSDTDDDFQEDAIKTKRIPVAKNTTTKVLSLAEREKLISKYRKRSPEASSSKQKTSTVTAEDSDSDSGDDYLVNPNAIDLNSKFFDTSSATLAKKTTEHPIFDCNIGINSLSDSENDNDLENVIEPEQPNRQEHLHFDKHDDFNKNLEKAKDYLSNFKSTNFGQEETVDVTKLLAMGETTTNKPLPQSQLLKKVKKQSAKVEAADTDSDWEEVAEKRNTIEDVIVTLGPTIKPKIDRCQSEIEAQIKRKINRLKKEQQLLIHKTHLLCWIGYGNNVNLILNSTKLMQMALNFMPSKHCYPKDRTDLDYFEQITKWYNNQMALKHRQMYPQLKKLPPMATSLALQIRAKATICKRDHIFIFIILLRAIGIQCRLVINLAIAPIRPPSAELCTINKKPTASTSTASTLKKTNSKDTKNKSKLNSSSHSSSSPNQPPKLEKLKTKSNTSKMLKSADNNEILTHSQSKASLKFNKNEDKKKEVYQKSTSENTQMKPDLKKLTLKPKSAAKTNVEVFSNTTRMSDDPQPSTSRGIKEKLEANKSIKTVNMQEMTSKIENKKRTNVQGSKSSVTNKRTKMEQTTPQKLSSSESGSKNSPIFSQNVLNIVGSPISRRTRAKSTTAAKTVPQLDGGDDRSTGQIKRRKAKEQEKEDSDDESDFVPRKKMNLVKNKILKEVKRFDTRILSTDTEDPVTHINKKNRMDFWVEVYCEVEEKWIAVDVFKSKIHCVDTVRANASKPISYVFAWNNNSTIKDVSPRYCLNWFTVTRKQRIDEDWLNETLERYKDSSSRARNKAEDRELNKIHLKEPLPSAISEYKNHPLYALERHLLKFEAIYPPNALTLGFIRNEPVYSRDCVHTCRSREIWVKEARVVKPKEEPYKIVKARPKWDRHTNKMLEPQPLEIFGYWQTGKYEPPTAANGLVPRNPYGNVELFKPEMLPKKTVHLQLPGLNRTCKKLQIDCAQAVTGFDFHSGSSHPVYDGFVVCEEFSELVVDQWFKDQEEAERKENEKREQKVIGNWKKLIKGLLIRRRLQLKYNFTGINDEEEKRPKVPEIKIKDDTTAAKKSKNRKK